MIIWNPKTTAETTSFALELESFARPRRVAAALNGVPVGDLWVDTTTTFETVGPIELRPGLNELALTPVGVALTPHSLDPASSDTRPLAIRLGEWSVSARSAVRNETRRPLPVGHVIAR